MIQVYGIIFTRNTIVVLVCTLALQIDACVFISVNYDKKEEQMAKASINIQVAGGNSEKHMDRESKTTYLLDPDSKNNEYQTFKSSEDYLNAAKVAAKEITGRTMQKLAEKNFVQEAVLNLEENHTLDNVKKVFEDLQKEFGGFEVFKIAVHKDEGYFYHKNEELEYRPNRDIFFNEKDKTFYLDKNHTKEADLNQFEKRYNYHAHVLFTKFDMNKGKNARLNKSDMRKVQTITAKSLGMERGEEFSKAKRKSHWQLKEAHDIKRDVKKEVLAKKIDIDSLKKEVKSEMIAEGGHTKEDYKALNDKFKELQEQQKTDKLTIETLKAEVNTWKHSAMNWKEAKSYQDLYAEVKEENRVLEAKISDLNNLGVQADTKMDKNDLKAISELLEGTNSVGQYDKIMLLENLERFEKEDMSKDFAKMVREKGEHKKPSMMNKRHTVTFEMHDLKSFLQKLEDAQKLKEKVIKSAKELLNKFEKPLNAVKSFVHKHFTTPKAQERMRERQKEKAIEQEQSKKPKGMER
jgi:hypothetical protein